MLEWIRIFAREISVLPVLVMGQPTRSEHRPSISYEEKIETNHVSLPEIREQFSVTKGRLNLYCMFDKVHFCLSVMINGDLKSGNFLLKP